MSKSKRAKYRSIDHYTIFFNDVAQQSVIGGKNEYLPLTRRIERGILLNDLVDQDVEVAVQRIQDALNERLQDLYSLVSSDIVSDFLARTSGEIETFLDRPDWDKPPSFVLLENELQTDNAEVLEDIRRAGWQCTLLISLFPEPTRSEWKQMTNLESISSHFDSIKLEYKESKQKLIEGTLRYAIRLARYYIHSGIPFFDLVQEGFLGGMYAIDKFQEVAGAHFQSYTANWIQQRIRRYIADHSRLIRIPVHQHEKVGAIDEADSKLWDLFGRQPSDRELFLELGWLISEDFQVIELSQKQEEYQQVSQKLMNLRELGEYRDRPMSEIPQDIRQRVIELDNGYSAVEGQNPLADEIDVFQYLGWLTFAEINLLRNPPPNIPDRKVSQSLNKLRKARLQINHYRMSNARHYSIERSLHKTKEESLFLEDYLVARHDTEVSGDKQLLVSGVQDLLQCLGERERDVINLRFGLVDGQERTLEEIGQEYGVTRERIRQIEAKAMRKLRNPARNYKMEAFANNLDRDVGYFADIAKNDLLRKIDHLETLGYESKVESEARRVSQQVAYIDNLIETHIMRGRRRTSTGSLYGSRSQMFSKVLDDVGHPMHYTAIHEEILKILPPDQHYPKERTYATLFYSEKFQLLGNGMFGLAAWDLTSAGSSGEKILQHCPQPLLPENANARSFFESIMVGRELLTQQPNLSSRVFYAEMLAWARREDSNWIYAQSAFDAWYIVGLIERVELVSGHMHSIQLTISPEAKLNEVRQHCLTSLCRRVLKMPEMLLTLKRIARPTIADIQKVLFGGERAGFDVPFRLNLLAAFEAVQRSGDEWRLTLIGENVLQNNQPQELPDFSLIEEVTSETDDIDDISWEDELGLLDI